MKAIGWATLVLLLLHLLAGAGYVGWLASSGRIDRDRLRRAAAIFEVPIEEEKQQVEKLKAEAEQQAKKLHMAQALQHVETVGLKSFNQMITESAGKEQVADLRADRIARDIEDLRRRFEADKQLVEKRLKEVQAREMALKKLLEEEASLRESRDFKLAVQMYEQLKPRQVKDMFAELIRQNQTGQVVEYLAAMQLRQAASVIKEFKAPQEVPVATQLMELLRARGVNLLAPALGRAEPAAARAGGST